MHRNGIDVKISKYIFNKEMKSVAIIAALFPFLLASASAADDGCPNSYIKRTNSVQKQSHLYLVQVPKDFSVFEAGIKAMYTSISSRQNPTHQCIFYEYSHPMMFYRRGACKNMVTGRQTSVFGGIGYKIGEDGHTTVTKEYGTIGGFLEDSNKNRILVASDIGRNLDYSEYLISDCTTGTIEGVNFRQAFPGYIIIERASEKGFVNTYQGAPSIKF